MSDKLQIRRDTKSQWETYNPILSEGELCFESDTKKIKIGDGVHNWNELSYLNLGGSGNFDGKISLDMLDDDLIKYIQSANKNNAVLYEELDSSSDINI